MNKIMLMSIASLGLLGGSLSVSATAQVQPNFAPVSAQAPAQQAQAPGQVPAFTDPQNVPADLARVDAALNNTSSFSGRFAQYAADGSVEQGQIYLQRPGRLRFEYDAPSPLLIVSDGVTMTQQDRALETIDRVPLASTPLNFFLKENVNLARDTEVVAVQKFANEWRIAARDGSGEMDGVITMIFQAQTLALKEWVITDGFGGNTRVVLSNLRYNERLNPRLFTPPRADNRRDRRR